MNLTCTPNTPVIVISKKLFCLILVGLGSLAAASICSIMQLPMHQAVILFLCTWLVLIGLFELGTLLQPKDSLLRGSPKHK